MADARRAAPILEVRGLDVYYGRSHALQGVDLTLDAIEGAGMLTKAQSGGHADGSQAGQSLNDAVRLRAIAHDVSEMPDRVDRPDGREHRVEGDEVRVDV